MHDNWMAYRIVIELIENIEFFRYLCAKKDEGSDLPGEVFAAGDGRFGSNHFLKVLFDSEEAQAWSIALQEGVNGNVETLYACTFLSLRKYGLRDMKTLADLKQVTKDWFEQNPEEVRKKEERLEQNATKVLLHALKEKQENWRYIIGGIRKKMKLAGFKSNEEGLCVGLSTICGIAFRKKNKALFSGSIEMILNLTEKEFTSIIMTSLTATPEDLEKKLTILGFFNAIELYHQPQYYSNLFLETFYNLYNTEKISSLFESGGSTLISLTVDTNIYDIEALKKYLGLLQSNIKVDSTFLLGSSNHAINLSYSVSDQVWIFSNPGDESILGERVIDINQLASLIFLSFEEGRKNNGLTGFSTVLLTNDSEKVEANNFIQCLQECAEFKELASITQEKRYAKVNTYNFASPVSWLELAADANNTQQLKKLLFAVEEVDAEQQADALASAVSFEFVSAVQVLLSSGAYIYPNLLNWAVEDKKQDVTFLLWIYGAHSESPEIEREAEQIVEERLTQKANLFVSKFSSLSMPISPRIFSNMLRDCCDHNERVMSAFLTNPNCRVMIMQHSHLVESFRELLVQYCAQSIQPMLKKIKADYPEDKQKEILKTVFIQRCNDFSVEVEDVMRKTYTGEMSDLDSFCDRLLKSGAQVMWFTRPAKRMTFFSGSADVQTNQDPASSPSRPR